MPIEDAPEPSGRRCLFHAEELTGIEGEVVNEYDDMSIVICENQRQVTLQSPNGSTEAEVCSDHADYLVSDQSEREWEFVEQQTLVADGGARPHRDISARTAIGECEYCGGNANSLLGGEHIWKCSEIVPKGAVEQFIDDLRHNSERRSYASFDGETADEIADELEELIV